MWQQSKGTALRRQLVHDCAVQAAATLSSNHVRIATVAAIRRLCAVAPTVKASTAAAPALMTRHPLATTSLRSFTQSLAVAASSEHARGDNVHASPTGSIDADTTPTQQAKVCVLCDVPFTSWEEHTRLPAHGARVAICQTFVVLDRSESIMQQLEKHIQLDFRAVDEVTIEKVRRRHGRLSSTLSHLVDEGVLAHSLPYLPTVAGEASACEEEQAGHGDSSSSKTVVEECGTAPESKSTLPPVAASGPSCSVKGGEWQVHDKFMNFVLNGEGYAQQEVLDRTARLMPSIGATELASVVAFVLAPRHLARLYDELGIDSMLLARRLSRSRRMQGGTAHSDSKVSTAARDEKITASLSPVTGEAGSQEHMPLYPRLPLRASTPVRPLRRDEKALVILACLGELAHFSRQDRNHHVADRTAAGRLVQHVLATHAMENVTSELVHDVLQRAVTDGTPVWREYLSHQKTFAEKVTPSATAVRSDGRGLGNASAMAPPPLPLMCARSPSPTPVVSAAQTKSLQQLQTQLRAFLPLERAGTGSSATGSKQVHLAPAVGDVPTYAAPVWRVVTDGMGGVAAAPMGAAASHPGAVFAPPSPRLVSRKVA